MKWASVSAGSTSVDSDNRGGRVCTTNVPTFFLAIIPEAAQYNSCFHTVYLVSGVISSLEMI